MRSKSQLFADTVFPKVQEIAALQQQNQDLRARKYKSLCKRAGSLVRNSGLIQTLAFFMAKGQRDAERHHLDLLHHLQTELRSLNILPQGNDLAEHARTVSLPEYMYMTREVLHLLNWHKRLADTLIEGTADNDDTGDE